MPDALSPKIAIVTNSSCTAQELFLQQLALTRYLPKMVQQYRIFILLRLRYVIKRSVCIYSGSIYLRTMREDNNHLDRAGFVLSPLSRKTLRNCTLTFGSNTVNIFFAVLHITFFLSSFHSLFSRRQDFHRRSLEPRNKV